MAETAAIPEENVEDRQEFASDLSIDARASSSAVRVGLDIREYRSPRKEPSTSRSNVVLGSMEGDRPEDDAVGTMPACDRTEFICKGGWLDEAEKALRVVAGGARGVRGGNVVQDKGSVPMNVESRCVFVYVSE